MRASDIREILKVTAPVAAPLVVLPRPNRELQVQDLSVTPPGADKEAVSHISFALTAGTAMAAPPTSPPTKPAGTRGSPRAPSTTAGMVIP